MRRKKIWEPTDDPWKHDMFEQLEAGRADRFQVNAGLLRPHLRVGHKHWHALVPRLHGRDLLGRVHNVAISNASKPASAFAKCVFADWQGVSSSACSSTFSTVTTPGETTMGDTWETMGDHCRSLRFCSKLALSSIWQYSQIS